MKVSWPSEEKVEGRRRERDKMQKRESKGVYGGGFIFGFLSE